MICKCHGNLLSLTQNTQTEKKCINCGLKIPPSTFYLTCQKSKTKNKPNYCINCKLCPKFHNLNFVKNLKPQSSGNLSSLYLKNWYICDFCKIKRDNNGEGKVLHCISCGFDFCHCCLEKFEKKIVSDLEGFLKNK